MSLKKISDQIENGITHKKCHKCGCQQGTIKALEKNISHYQKNDQIILQDLIEKAKKTFLPVEYDCLGCSVCFPAIATSEMMKAYPTIQIEDDGCGMEDLVERENEEWPPLSGNYQVLNSESSVAICTLNSKALSSEIALSSSKFINIVGSLSTENLGIERIIKNVISNPSIRFLIVCGEDTQQSIGHLPGQSLKSLCKNGVDASKRIIGAMGKRPILKNIDLESIEFFRKQVSLIDMIENSNLTEILKLAELKSMEKTKQLTESHTNLAGVPKITAKFPNALVLDPKGYFVIYPDTQKNNITVEHYLNNGVLNQVIEGSDVASIYSTIISLDLISRLDHACYLGKELTRADESLRLGTAYVQDKAQDVPDADTNEEIKQNICSKKGCC